VADSPEGKIRFASEFYHPHFGWLRHDREFETREAADQYTRMQGEGYGAYRRRVVKIEAR
jgi:hypothetical protein